MSICRKEYMKNYQRERRKKHNVRLLCVELFGPEEHAILDELRYHAENQNTTIRDLVVMSLKGACAHEQ
jgi:hypothetical protein